jgi:hypothetical protein
MSTVMPLLLALTAHYFLLSSLIPGAFSLETFLKKNFSDQVASTGLPLMIAFLTAAQVLSMLQGVLLELLEGKHLVGPLRGYFVGRQQYYATSLASRLRYAAAEAGQFALHAQAIEQNPANPTVERKKRKGEMVEWRDFHEGAAPAARIPIRRDQYQYVLNRLKDETDRLESTLRFTIPQIGHPEPGRGYSSAIIAPTTMGNIGKTMRAYALTRYGLDLDIFWTRFQRTISNGTNDKFIDLIQGTKSQVDFAVASVFLITAVWLGWVIYLLQHGSFFHLILVAGLGPYVSILSYRLACQNYLVFADQMRTAVDMYRLALLNDFSLPRPANSDEEKDLWNLLGTHVGFDKEVYFTYRKS